MPDPGALPYRIVDVFTSAAYAGNPLAVVFDAGSLGTQALQAIAREFNLSETAFPLPPTPEGAAGGADYRLRIFTPSTELPFAGHPSIGGCWAAREAGIVDATADRHVQECGAGLLPLDVQPDGRIRLTGGDPHLGEEADPAAALAAVGLAADDRVGEDGGPRWCGCGIDFCFLRVRRDALDRCRPDPSAVAALCGAAPGRTGVMTFAWDPETRTAHARVFAGGAGVTEDPAPGSAALGLGVWLADAGLAVPDGTTSYTVVQGIEMGRPSQLYAEVSAAAGHAATVTVAGGVVPVAEGRITPPAA